MTKKLPGEGAAEGDPYDCTGLIGQLGEDAMCEWPMSSFDAPAYTVWNAIAATFNRAGWSDHQIRDWLQSKQASAMGDGYGSRRSVASSWRGICAQNLERNGRVNSGRAVVGE